MTLNYVLWILGIVVGLYLLIIGLVGFWKGWDAVKKIWYWTWRLGWLVLVLIGILITVFASGRKNKKVQDINEKLVIAKGKEDKTEEDLRIIKELEKEKKKAEDDIVGITEKYKKALEDLKKKEPKPGDAGISKDDLDKVW